MLEPKVVFATDFRGDVGRGLGLATRLARDRAATLVVLHVIPFDPSSGEALLHQAAGLDSGDAQHRLAHLVPPDAGVPFLHALELGVPEDRIADFVEREGVDLLVMETRPRSMLRRALGRSLVERLIDRVRCAVVTYRDRRGSEEAAASRPPLLSSPARSPEALTTILNARIDALLTWMHLRREAVVRIAHTRSVADAVASLHRSQRHGRGSIFAARIRQQLELELGEHCRGLGALGVEVADRDRAWTRLGLGARRDATYAEFLDRLDREGAAISVPLEPAGRDTNVTCVVVAGARIRLSEREHGVLLLSFDARRDFLRILAQPGPVPSAETYAFDDRGVMLSNSRFPDQLRRVGLLPPDPGVQTPRRLRVCDPGGNLLAGEVPLQPLRPLTRMAAAATAGEDGCDWKGYRDYRGVEVVGTWRWLPDHGFGVAAEMDRQPA